MLRDDLPTWQKLNVTAFMVSGIAGTVAGVVGEDYEDGSGNIYLPMFRQPVLVFTGTAEQMRTVYERMRSRDLRFAIFTEELFRPATTSTIAPPSERARASDLNIVGLAVRADKKIMDKVLRGLSLHQ